MCAWASEILYILNWLLFLLASGTPVRSRLSATPINTFLQFSTMHYGISIDFCPKSGRQCLQRRAMVGFSSPLKNVRLALSNLEAVEDG